MLLQCVRKDAPLPVQLEVQSQDYSWWITACSVTSASGVSRFAANHRTRYPDQIIQFTGVTSSCDAPQLTTAAENPCLLFMPMYLYTYTSISCPRTDMGHEAHIFLVKSSLVSLVLFIFSNRWFLPDRFTKIIHQCSFLLLPITNSSNHGGVITVFLQVAQFVEDSSCTAQHHTEHHTISQMKLKMILDKHLAAGYLVS